MAQITAAVTNEDLAVTNSSGNVFADLGFADAEELQVKAVLTYHVYSRIKALGLTQKEVVARLGISQPDVSKLMHCRHTGFSSDRLLAFLVALDLDIDIVLRPRDDFVAAPHLRVHLRQPRMPRQPRRPRAIATRPAGRQRSVVKKRASATT
jgi:predicted XRE-type DNA-binding protein